MGKTLKQAKSKKWSTFEMRELYESLMTRKEVADMLGVSAKTVERMEKRGYIPRVEIPGGSVRYKPSSIIKAVNRWEKFRPDNPNCQVAFRGDNLRDTYIER